MPSEEPDPGATIPFSTLPSQSPPLVPTALQLGELLGKGGMGSVHAAEQPPLSRGVAVKVPPADDPKGHHRSALFREAQVMGMLEHPNIVPVHDLRFDDGQPQLLMKRIDGVTWGEILDNPNAGPIDAHSVGFHVDVLRQVCNALRYAHSKHILHRDIKPENIMVGAFGEVYLVDWGVAISFAPPPNPTIPHVKFANSMVGTPYYMAPEMFNPERERPTTATDVYLLGGAIYRWISGNPPRSAGSLVQMLAASLRPPPFDPEWPSDLVDLCGRCLARDPNDRPTLREVDTALRQHLEVREINRVVNNAVRGAQRLERLLTQDTTTESLVETHGLFGACRFGFEEALHRDPDHRAAREGRHGLLATMATHHLKQGNASLALNLLQDMRRPPKELLARARSAITEAEGAAEKLSRLEEDVDMKAGSMARVAVIAGLGLLWFLIPTLFLRTGLIERGTGFELIRLALSLPVVATLAIMGRRPLRKSRVNRGLLAMIVISPLVRALGAVAFAQLDTPPEALPVLTTLIDGVSMVVAAALLDARAIPATAFYLMCGLATAFVPEHATTILQVGTVLLIPGIIGPWLYDRFLRPVS